MPRTPNSEITIDVGGDAADFDPIQQAATIDVEEIHSNPINVVNMNTSFQGPHLLP